MKFKYKAAIKYICFALAACALAAVLISAVDGGSLTFISKDTPDREEFEIETEDAILDDLLNEGDVSAIVQNEYEKYIASLTEASGLWSSRYVPGTTEVAVLSEYTSFSVKPNRSMPAYSGTAAVPSGYSCVGGENGILVLCREGAYGYYSEKGVWITPPVYQAAYAFSGGVAVIKQNGLYGLVDTEGNIVLPVIFDSVSDMEGSGVTVYKSSSGYTRLVFTEKQ